MKFAKEIRRLVLLIIVLGLLASLAGLLMTSGGQPYDFVSARGEEVQINNRGLINTTL